ncbi:unnamed protein product [Bursaphelenchus xylophilus]|nr:unnamed protein product [Bursaphelenchus xylophilus]CAG9126429.1 unnamed protein product [Bursaphelenchus xylophilus]
MAWAQIFSTVLLLLLICALHTPSVRAFRFYEMTPAENSEEAAIVKRQNDWKQMFGQNFKAEADEGNFGFKGLRGKRGDMQRALRRPCNIYKLISCY